MRIFAAVCSILERWLDRCALEEYFTWLVTYVEVGPFPSKREKRSIAFGEKEKGNDCYTG